MTNKELIEKLQESVEKYGELPVSMVYIDSCNIIIEESVKDILYDDLGISIYNK